MVGVWEDDIQRDKNWVFLFEESCSPYEPRFIEKMTEEQKKQPIPILIDERIGKAYIHGFGKYRYYVNKITHERKCFITYY